MIKILYLGDIVGSSGRRIVKKAIPIIKQKHEIDIVIANAENAAHGKGITKKIYYQLLESGIDLFSMGNHTFAKSDIYELLDKIDNMVVPDNMNRNTGVSTLTIKIKDRQIRLSNVMCEVFMHNTLYSPFEAIQTILDTTKSDIHIVDIHGEATSEKIAFAYAFKNYLTAIVGTHTHVQTADEKILDGCAYITDLGMCGTYHSILGRDIEEILARFLYKEKKPYKIAEGEAILHGVIITIDEKTNRSISIERLKLLENEL